MIAADRCYRLPSGVAPDAAVAVLHPAATAWLALSRHAVVHPGDTVFVGGGGGNVGRAAIEFAAAAGAHVVASARSDDADACRALGAAVVVDYRAADATTQIAAAAPSGVDVHIDTSGCHDMSAAVDLLAPGGTIVLIAARPAPVVPLNDLYRRDGRIVGFVISRGSIADLASAAAAINARLARGRLRANITAELPLSDAAQVHRMLDDGSIRGRVIIRPSLDTGP